MVGIITRKDVLYGGDTSVDGVVPRDASDLRMTYGTDPTHDDGDSDDDDGGGGGAGGEGGGGGGGWQPLGWVGMRLSQLRGRLSGRSQAPTGRSTQWTCLQI